MTSRAQVCWFMAAIGCLFMGFVAGRRSTGTAEDPRPAVAAVDQAIGVKDWQAGHDALLIALRIATDDEQVFDAGCRYVAAAQQADDEAQLLAQDVLQRLDAAIPYQPLVRVQAARKRVSELTNSDPIANRFNQKPLPADDPFAAVEDLLQTANGKGVPLAVRTRLVQEVDGELAAICRRAAGGKEIDWRAYHERKARHEECQKGVTRELFEETFAHGRQFEDWKARVQAFVQKYDIADPRPEPKTVDPEAGKLTNEGQRLLREAVTYSEAGVSGAKQLLDSGTIEGHIGRVVRLREWVYNRWVEAHLARVERGDGVKSPLFRLYAIAEVDEGRLVPYMSERFASLWQQWFAECSHDEKLAAMKARILRGLKP